MGINFPTVPTLNQLYPQPAVAGLPVYRWDGEKWTTSSITANKTPIYTDGSTVMAAQLKLIAPPVAAADAAAKSYVDGSVKKKNYVINGAMQISQENGSTSGAFAPAGYFPVDNFVGYISGSTGTATIIQLAAATPAGSPNRIQAYCSAVDTVVGATDMMWIEHRIEGLRFADLRYGSAAFTKTTTLQFGVNAQAAGTYCVTFLNSASNRSYVAEYVVTAGEAGNDVVKSVTIPGDTTGTWVKDTGVGLKIRWALMVGSTYQQAAGAWGTGSVMGSPNQINFMAANNTFELFDVSLTEGTAAPAFQVPDYISELALCQRYWERCTAAYRQQTANTNAVVNVPFKVPKRTQSTLTFISNGSIVASSTFSSFMINDVFGVGVQFTVGANVDSYNFGFTITANARL